MGCLSKAKALSLIYFIGNTYVSSWMWHKVIFKLDTNGFNSVFRLLDWLFHEEIFLKMPYYLLRAGGK